MSEKIKEGDFVQIAKTNHHRNLGRVCRVTDDGEYAIRLQTNWDKPQEKGDYIVYDKAVAEQGGLVKLSIMQLPSGKRILCDMRLPT